MTRYRSSLPSAYFDDLYAKDGDPWRFASSDYEREKYAATLQALPNARYASALEVGCSIGVLTRQLAARCEALLAVDLATAALNQARTRCSDLDHVRFEQRCMPADWPDGRFDLVLLSEVVYYLDRADVVALVSKLRDALQTGGHVMLVHWLGETHYPLTGDEAAETFIERAADFTSVIRRERFDQYRLDVLQR